MNIKNLSAAIVILLASIPIAHAVSLKSLSRCTYWTSNRNEDSAILLEAEIIAYLNAVSHASEIEFWGAKSSQFRKDQAFQWMDAYCAKNKDSDTMTGSILLFRERVGSPSGSAPPAEK